MACRPTNRHHVHRSVQSFGHRLLHGGLRFDPRGLGGSAPPWSSLLIVLEIAIPLVYELDADLKPIPNKFSSRLMAIPSVPSKGRGDIAGDVIPGRKIPVATPLVYELDADLKLIPNKFSSQFMAIPSVPS